MSSPTNPIPPPSGPPVNPFPPKNPPPQPAVEEPTVDDETITAIIGGWAVVNEETVLLMAKEIQRRRKADACSVSDTLIP